jgi:hypothetical protein
MNKDLTNEEVLELIRADRPGQVIHEVTSFKQGTKPGYDWEINVVMEGDFLGTTIRRVNMQLPYPLKTYKDLEEKFKAHL